MKWMQPLVADCSSFQLRQSLTVILSSHPEKSVAFDSTVPPSYLPQSCVVFPTFLHGKAKGGKTNLSSGILVSNTRGQ